MRDPRITAAAIDKTHAIIVKIATWSAVALLLWATPDALSRILTPLENQVYLAIHCASCYDAAMYVVNFTRPADDKIVPLNAAFETRMAAEAERARIEREYVAYRAAAERYKALHPSNTP